MDLDNQGPTMLAATALLRPGPARIGSLSKNVVLPRTVRVAAVAGGGVGMIVGIFVGGPLAALTGNGQLVLWSMGLFAALGVAAVSYSPLEGESLGKWITLSARASRNGIVVSGAQRKVIVVDRATEPPADAVEVAATGDYVAYATANAPEGAESGLVYLGICPMNEIIAGPVRIVRSCVEVPAGSVNSRGVPV